jgi:plasmid stabilization system protein ParE
MPFRVVVTPEARNQIDGLHSYVAAEASAAIAGRFVDGIVDHIATLQEFPNRGTPRDNLRSGLRTLAWRRRVTIAFVVEERDVVVIGVFYGGRDLKTLLSSD